MIQTPELSIDPPDLSPEPPSRRTAERWLTALLAVAGLALAAVVCLTRLPSWDLWWQMKTGELILKSGHVPTTDPFSFTAPGHPWIAQEWLVEVLFYGLYTHLGPLSLVAFKLVAAALAFGLLMARCLRRSSGDVLLSSFLVLLAAFAVREHMDIRPQAVSFILLGVLMWVLEGREAEGGGRKAESDGSCPSPVPPSALRLPPSVLRWAPAAILALWVNCHAAFVLGLGIVGAYAVGAWWEGERGKRWLVAWGLPGLAALGATLLNPYSYHALAYPAIWMSTNFGVLGTGAWASPDFHGRPAQGLEAVLLVWFCVVGISRRQLAARETCLTLGLALTALLSAPLTPYFVLATLPWLAGLIHIRRPGLQQETARLAAGLVAVLLVLVLILARAPKRDWFATLAQTGDLPSVACDRIHTEGWSNGMLAERDWGGYCAWRFFPRRVVFMDTRLELFPSEVAEDFNACMNAYPDMEQRLWRRGIRTLLLRRSSIAARFIEQSPLWRCAYSDALVVVFRRTTPRREASLETQEGRILPRAE